MAGRLRGNRTVAVTLAIVLVFVPTLFAVFPNFATAPLWVRVLVIVVWGGVAAATAVAARVKDDQRDALATAQFDLVVSEALAGVLAAVGEPYEPAVYLPGREGAPLARFWPPDADADEFPIGVGAVGRCYGTGADQFFVGDAVHSAETGLGLAQQRRYERYVVVGAVPIPSTTAATASIGVLSVIARHNDGRYCSKTGAVDAAGLGQLRELAERVGQILAVRSRAGGTLG